MDANDGIPTAEVTSSATTFTRDEPRADHQRALTHAQGLNPRALARAQAFIEQHLGEPFTLSDLANAACVSRFHFARAFRVSMGLSPMEYVLQTRIERAKQALAEGRQKISAAAAEFGFFDHSHFARRFRRMTGVSPREFMRIHR